MEPCDPVDRRTGLAPAALALRRKESPMSTRAFSFIESSRHRPACAPRLYAALSQLAEPLEPRRLFAVDFCPPLPVDTVSVQLLRDGAAPGVIDVYLNGDVNPTDRFYQFTRVDGTDVIDAGNLTITCQDFVPAFYKPQAEVGGAIQFIHGQGCTLELDGSNNDDDLYYGVVSSDATSTRVRTSETFDPQGAAANTGEDVYFGAWAAGAETGTGFTHVVINSNEV